MSRFRIHRSFEEELAKKADEFSMQPSQSTWQGIEKGINKTQSIQTFWKISILGLSLLAILGIFFIQDTKNSARSAFTEAGISLLTPLSNGSFTKGEESKASDPGIIPVKPGLAIAVIPSVEKAESGKNRFNPTLSPESPTGETQKIMLKALKPKAISFEINLNPNSEISTPKVEKRAAGRKNRDGWYVQANYGPAYAYRNISSRTDYARPLEESKKQLDKGVFGFSARVQARYHFSDRFSLAFGLGYTRSGERIGMAPRKNSKVYDALAEEYNYETSEMNALGNLTYFTNKYSYAELPVTLYSKRPLSPRLSLTTGFGLSLGYLITTNARCYDYRVDHYVNNPRFFRDWTIGSHAQVLLEYSLDTRWAIAAGPELTYALLSTYRNYYTLSQHQFSIGMNFGVQWKLFDVTKSRLAD